MNNNPTSNPSSQDDKTQVFNTSSTGTGSTEDKTIVSSSDNNGTSGDATAGLQQASASPSSGKPQPKAAESGKASGFSAGAMAAGVAGAGIAGAAAGVAFSDPIKDAIGLNTDETAAEEAATSSAETPEVSSAVGTASADAVTAAEVDTDKSAAEVGSTFEMEYTDSDGNIYNVSFQDLDGDGTVDEQYASIDFEDGSSIEIMQSGDSLSPMFTSGLEFASAVDHATNASYDHTSDAGSDSSTYEIQAGDTLSEIAQAHHTSIENIMELNPDITDPNVIYAGDQIEIPVGDNISNPYQTSSPILDTYEETEPSDASYTSETLEVSEGDFEFSDEMDESVTPDSGDFQQIDWAVFNEEDNVGVNAEYENELAETDFGSFETPDSYLEDYGSGDFNASDFL